MRGKSTRPQTRRKAVTLESESFVHSFIHPSIPQILFEPGTIPGMQATITRRVMALPPWSSEFHRGDRH